MTDIEKTIRFQKGYDALNEYPIAAPQKCDWEWPSRYMLFREKRWRRLRHETHSNSWTKVIEDLTMQLHRFDYETMTGRCWFRKVSSYEKPMERSAQSLWRGGVRRDVDCPACPYQTPKARATMGAPEAISCYETTKVVNLSEI